MRGRSSPHAGSERTRADSIAHDQRRFRLFLKSRGLFEPVRVEIRRTPGSERHVRGARLDRPRFGSCHEQPADSEATGSIRHHDLLDPDDGTVREEGRMGVREQVARDAFRGCFGDQEQRVRGFDEGRKGRPERLALRDERRREVAGQRPDRRGVIPSRGPDADLAHRVVPGSFAAGPSTEASPRSSRSNRAAVTGTANHNCPSASTRALSVASGIASRKMMSTSSCPAERRSTFRA